VAQRQHEHAGPDADAPRLARGRDSHEQRRRQPAAHGVEVVLSQPRAANGQVVGLDDQPRHLGVAARRGALGLGLMV